MKLTIAIPTYNRIEYLKELLPRLFHQCKPYPDIEILISDNATTDGTYEYLVNQTWNSQLEYRFNETNVGGDENMVRCVESARGEYVWLFGDDELLCNGAIDLVMTILKTEQPSLLVIGDVISYHPYFKGDYKKYIQNSTIRMLLNQTLITCNIFRKELFDPTLARELEHTNYGHKYTLMHSLQQGGIIIRLPEPIIIVRNTRAPSQDNLHFIRTKQINYLRHLGVSYPRVLEYIITGLFYPSIQRQIKKVVS